MAESKKRRGKTTKSNRSPAEFKPGAAETPAPDSFDPEKIAAELDLWWENSDGKGFWVGGSGGDARSEGNPQVWARWPQEKLIDLLKTKWVRQKRRAGEILSETSQVFLHVMQYRRADMVLTALAGYPAGIHEVGGHRLLVRTSPRLIVPREGDWGNVRELINRKLDFSWASEEGHGINQTPYFHGWMKIALEGLLSGGPSNFRPGQAMIFAGPRDCGKSRLQHQVITGLLGGRSADPGPYLFGRTDFNGEMFASEHLMMEDPASSTKTADRVFFGEMLKQLVANDTQRLHSKGADALILSPFFRTTISVNDDPDKMRVLPLLTPDMKDKVMLFLVTDAGLPMPTATLADRAAFRKQIASELPAYAWWLLNEFEIPEGMKSARFGVKEWHHPTLACELFDETPAGELLALIDAADFRASEASPVWEETRLWDLKSDAEQMGDGWVGSSIRLEQLFLNIRSEWICSISDEAKRLLCHHKIARLLSRLKEDRPDRVIQYRTRIKRAWRILPPRG